MQTERSKIVYTKTDEAPALATYSLLPIIRAFLAPAGIELEVQDISLAARILALFSDRLPVNQQEEDALAEMAALVQKPEANIIKLPNISASIPQLKAAIKELQGQGFAVPDYIEEPQTAEEQEDHDRYNTIKGSAVNPVLREGNSDRRVPPAVKNYVRRFPHKMGAWDKESKTHVASMKEGDFYGSEQSCILSDATEATIQFVSSSGESKVLRESVPLLKGEVIDAATMSLTALKKFAKEEIRDAKAKGVLFSLHLKATMMKVSDPIIFGAVASVFYEEVIEKFSELFTELGVNFNNGLGDVYARLANVDAETRQAVEEAIDAVHAQGAGVAMVNSDKGITNFHVPSDVIIDASMPPMIRDSGKMWNRDGELQDVKAVIPDRSYASVYQETVDFCKEHGALDPQKMGTVANIGLMAQKAEEYGSHDKTFQLQEAGSVQVVDKGGNVLLELPVAEGDIFRMCQTKDTPIREWVKLAVNRAKQTKMPAIFWLDPQRAHDCSLISKVEEYLEEHDRAGAEIHLMSPAEATRYTLERFSQGEDTIAVTGNVLRDYLTDLFPILEVGTSAKMLSIVPLLNGGSVFETGAGGSAPKHVQQFNEVGYLRWDSLGEFLALVVSLEHIAEREGNERAKVLGAALDRAVERVLLEEKSPARKLGKIDNRGSHFYLALYWSIELATQEEDSALCDLFAPLADQLSNSEESIAQKLLEAQGEPVDIGGYYHPDIGQATDAMRPCQELNRIIDRFRG